MIKATEEPGENDRWNNIDMLVDTVLAYDTTDESLYSLDFYDAEWQKDFGPWKKGDVCDTLSFNFVAGTVKEWEAPDESKPAPQQLNVRKECKIMVVPVLHYNELVAQILELRAIVARG